MQSQAFDNKTNIIKDDLIKVIQSGDKLSIASATFSMYAYQELKDKLENLEEFKFIFTSPTFALDATPKEKREFYIPRLAREKSIFGTEFEIKLRNELTQKAVAAECAKWIKQKARFKSFNQEKAMMNFVAVDGKDDTVGYMPFEGFTTSELGTKASPQQYSMIQRLDTSSSQTFLQMFDEAWNDVNVRDVTEQVIDSISTMYTENPPELIYYMTLFRVFNEFLEDISEDVLPDDGLRLKDSKIWNMLYDFQQEAVLSIINKLETYSGCILADSVGLGKTFTALAVIKYYENRNKNVLVLCPKKLSDNWLTFNSNVINNPIFEDRLGYDVLYHTDLLREKGKSETGIPLGRINWGAYHLVVIDESHNFRNGLDTSGKSDDKQNRYEKLMESVIKEGVTTKVLMLSATPVNNRFRDLRNQLALAYSGDSASWTEKLNIEGDIESVFRSAQRAFNTWGNLEADERTTETLTKMLDFDFFEVLDQVTVARSRKHIQRYYDVSAIGPFPKRNKPISSRPPLTNLKGAVNYREIYDQLDSLKLSIYMPSQYVLPSRLQKYADSNENLTVAGREIGIRRLMTVNLLKRLESSVYAFRLTLNRVLSNMEATLEKINEFEISKKEAQISDFDEVYKFDLDFDDEEEVAFEVGNGIRFDLADMDWKTWRRDIESDVENVQILLGMINDITPEFDTKLEHLYKDIREKVTYPLNGSNRKIIIFTAFADTAQYLFEHVSTFAKTELGLETAIITGTGGGKSTVKKLPSDMGTILACFSPISKERAAVARKFEDIDIDILIATDCISEGQNLQDCDYLVNYDIHWNPVRIVQRFGRIDRIGSKNDVIQLVNYWPDLELDEYIKLKARVEERMRITVMTSTGDDDYINENEQGDLEYRERQLRQMRDEVIDLEDVSGGVSITDLGLNEFRMDLIGYYNDNPSIEKLPSGIHAVVQGSEPGIIFVLRNVNEGVNLQGRNQIHPFYLVHISDDGSVVRGHLSPKDVLDEMRLLCRGKSKPELTLCKDFNKETKNGNDMGGPSKLLGDAVSSIIDSKVEDDIESFFSLGITGFLENEVAGLDDFELICFLVVRP